MPQIKLTLTVSELESLPAGRKSAQRVLRALRQWARSNGIDLFAEKPIGGKRIGAGRKRKNEITT